MNSIGKIQYLERPEWVSWHDIHECIVKSHEVNERNGLHMINQDLSDDEMKGKFDHAYCFVALDDKKVVGVYGLKIFKGKKWWSWNKTVAYTFMDGILPEYKGFDVYFKLTEMRMKYIKDLNADIMQTNTAESNYTILKITKIKKFKQVQFSPTGKGADYYSITLVKWLGKCPYPDWFIKFMFNLSKVVSKTLWKPGYKRRFWFN